MVTVGLAGALLGMANDLITSTLSPDYFVYFKGIEPGQEFRRNVLLLGSQAGLAAGAVGSGILLLCCKGKGSKDKQDGAKRRRSPIPMLLPLVKWPFLSAIAGGFSLGMVAHLLQWPRALGDVNGLLNGTQVQWLHTVWLTHIGLYLGAVLGLIGIITVVRRKLL